MPENPGLFDSYSYVTKRIREYPTYKAAAQDIGVSETTIKNYMAKKRNPQVFIARLFQLLEVMKENGIEVPNLNSLKVIERDF